MQEDNRKVGIEYDRFRSASLFLRDDIKAYCAGKAELLASQSISLICSIKCPGSIILNTFDLMRNIRDEDITIISGFHSPMEEECLNILLRGKCGIVICYARSLPARVPADLQKPIDDGRLLLLSSFDGSCNHITRKSSAKRNQLVAEMGDILLVPYASPEGMVEKACKEAIASGKNVFTFESKYNEHLLSAGAKTISLNSASILLDNIKKPDEKDIPKSVHSEKL